MKSISDKPPTQISISEKNIQLELFIFNKEKQLMLMRDVSLKKQEEKECVVSPDIRISKEGHLIAIPLIKHHQFGSGQY